MQMGLFCPLPFEVSGTPEFVLCTMSGTFASLAAFNALLSASCSFLPPSVIPLSNRTLMPTIRSRLARTVSTHLDTYNLIYSLLPSLLQLVYFLAIRIDLIAVVRSVTATAVVAAAVVAAAATAFDVLIIADAAVVVPFE